MKKTIDTGDRVEIIGGMWRGHTGVVAVVYQPLDGDPIITIRLDRHTHSDPIQSHNREAHITVSETSLRRA